jgi:hypothetical protein
MDSDSTAWKIQAKRRHFERRPFHFVWKLVDEDCSKLYYSFVAVWLSALASKYATINILCHHFVQNYFKWAVLI